MRNEYRELLLRIACDITHEELEKMKFLCADFIPYTKLAQVENILAEVFEFFCKLEAENKLGIDDLEWLKTMLDHFEKKELAIKVTEFEFNRRVYLSSLNASQRERESERNQTTRSQQDEFLKDDQRQGRELEVQDEQQAAVGNKTSRGKWLK